MARYPYYILAIRNRLPYTPDLSGVKKFLLEKTSLEPIIKTLDLDVPLNFEEFTADDGRNLLGLQGIKQTLRDTKKIAPNGYHSILFFYEQTESPNPGVTMGRAYPNDLEGAAFAEIPTQKGLVESGDTLRVTLHEMMHQFHRRLWWKNYPTDDTMDSYREDFNPYSATGNFAENLKILWPFWKLIAEAPTPSLAFLFAEISRLSKIVQELTALVLQRQPKVSKLDAWATAIKKFEGWFTPGTPGYPNGSISYQNNNPGNLRWSKYQIGTNKGFARFHDYETGWKALKFQLELAATNKNGVNYRPTMSLHQFFNVYAPATDSNYPEKYAEFVAKELGVSPTIEIRQLV